MYREQTFFGSKTFDLVTLIMDFDLVLKNFNWTILIEPNALGL
jgi:hypothetical protein